MAGGYTIGDVTLTSSVGLARYNNSGYVQDTNYDPANINSTYMSYGLTYAGKLFLFL